MSDHHPRPIPECRILPWDTEFFGFRIAQSTLSRPDADQLERMIAWCEREDVRCLYHLADPQDLSGLAAASRRGFELVDIRHEMDADTAAFTPHDDPPMPIEVREAAAADEPTLRRMARESFDLSRFAVDSRFPRERVGAMYERWLTRSWESGAVFVATDRDAVVGFVACEPDGAAAARIGLLAVSPDRRGSSFGRALVHRAMSWACESGFERLRVTAQGANVPALRAYEAAGLRTARVSLWYHRWF